MTDNHTSPQHGASPDLTTPNSNPNKGTASLYRFDMALPHCQWWLAITSPQISYNRGALDYDILEMRQRLEDANAWAAEFVDSWGIETRREWHQMIYRLAMGEVHGNMWEYEFNRRGFVSAKQWQDRLNNNGNEVAQGEMRYLDVVYRHVGSAGFRAWDFCRGSFLVRAGYAVGKVTAEECAFLLNYLSQQAQRYFSSWDHYLQSFIFGRNYWEYINDEDDDIDNIPYLLSNGFHVGFSAFFEALDNDPDSPIPALAWDTALPLMEPPESLTAILNEIAEDEK
ncbi:DUF1266 domain-containing protein [Enterovibrio norvegicus]|uniref:DUF1266 domain-containing protein n=1 Tax=Enterovibrio norvegicus TaxID=188144 RepID=A0ABV4L6A0_9GAMM|nr:DUF1266 domain-containing protein [Enterovibrio norvegicus]OEE63700.1 hypothetical protein A1OS_16800 [Enterovibrio norvegicus]OEF55868.1 hypothetical protein A1OU_13875 [Enterovibrio norvegicus]